MKRQNSAPSNDDALSQVMHIAGVTELQTRVIPGLRKLHVGCRAPLVKKPFGFVSPSLLDLATGV